VGAGEGRKSNFLIWLRFGLDLTLQYGTFILNSY
jgi:hypothetical protein